MRMMSTKEADRLDKLEQFFKEVANMTLHPTDMVGNSCVTTYALATALEKVDPDWWKKKY